MASVHVGRLIGPVGFSRTVAIKRLHPHFSKDSEFSAMLLDEARLASRIQHPNVVSIIDVVAEQNELLLVMDYIQSESLSTLLRTERERGKRMDPRIAVKIMSEVLSGLHAAHEVNSERGVPLGIVHRDVSPQNVLVGVDGVAHLIDFGVAKAAERIQNTKEGQLKGKLPYMSPEQIRSGTVDRRTDIYAAAAVLWEALVGRRLFKGNDANLMYAVLTVPVPTPRSLVPEISAELDAVVMKGLHRDLSQRFSTALEMADALEAALSPASSREVARWVEQLACDALERRSSMVARVESLSNTSLAYSVAVEQSAIAQESLLPSNPVNLLALAETAPDSQLGSDAAVAVEGAEGDKPIELLTLSGLRTSEPMIPRGSRTPWRALGLLSGAVFVAVLVGLAIVKTWAVSSRTPSVAHSLPTVPASALVAIPSISESAEPSASSSSPSPVAAAPPNPKMTVGAKPSKDASEQVTIQSPDGTKKRRKYTRD